MQVVEQLKQLSEERFLALYQTLSENGFGPLDREVAQSLRFRPQSIRKLPMEKRARRALQILLQRSNAELAYELFGNYLMKKSKALITEFLDGTGVPHEGGMIEDLDGAKPSADKLAGTLVELDRKYDTDDVTLYLSMCATQWPDMNELDAAWRSRLTLSS